MLPFEKFKNSSNFTDFDKGYPLKSVKNSLNFTDFDRGYPLKNVQKISKFSRGGLRPPNLPNHSLDPPFPLNKEFQLYSNVTISQDFLGQVLWRRRHQNEFLGQGGRTKFDNHGNLFSIISGISITPIFQTQWSTSHGFTPPKNSTF